MENPVFFYPMNTSLFKDTVIQTFDFFQIRLNNFVTFAEFNDIDDRDYLRDISEKMLPKGLTFQQVRRFMINGLVDKPTSINIVADWPFTFLKEERKLYDKYIKWKENGKYGLYSNEGLEFLLRSYQLACTLIDVCYELNPECKFNIFVDDGFQNKYIFGHLYNIKKKYYYYHFLEGSELGNMTQLYSPKSPKPENFQMQFIPWMQYGYFRNFNSEMLKKCLLDKQYDIVFGLHANTDEHDYRIKMIRMLNDIYPKLDQSKNILSGSSYEHIVPIKEISNLRSDIRYNDYMTYIRKAKWTFLIPSVNPAIFSLRRFSESLIHACIPFIDNTVNYKDGVNRDEEMISIIEQHLLFDLDKLEEKMLSISLISTAQYMELLHKIYKTKWFQQYINPKFYTYYLNKVEF